MLDLLKQRRSIRKFEQKPIEKEKIEILKKALLLAPSSRNLKPLEFIFLEDKEILNDISKCKPYGGTFIKNAALAVVILGDEDKSDVWVEDASIASIILQLQAESLGLGSCWSQVRNRKYDDNKMAEDYIKEKLNIKENYKVESIIAIGYKDETKEPIDEEKLDFNKIHINKFI
ncbi:nitroreductase family protein [Clostridium sporogenes]|uniref:NAD(P)H-dependent dehydrogenase/reductase n=1 Tax=Clostridium botulinum TaxID=1491 RepID=A0A6M0T252_CLOBO|nr:nitroreductase family protein [Clostridium sporogenes]NFA61235.1 NAD(P)H-dependent dehydrogenase/reductase [Clostridium botulinum]NFI72057.1 NAD(P)H-dependent dehydrogenase/reductase [Clostridium sporogenes]NFL72764.1 NAD(P)H-dependent dehydrogenase/reductase [Clostridium sporogenes]NFM24428.1 NAD(P)H-dependent dehydrogenase/reductase [Clostridium sporogenes]NFP61095.1 NAD(P)H-dependent dehydrogenase/reductase [Clostridium sporogenes]